MPLNTAFAAGDIATDIDGAADGIIDNLTTAAGGTGTVGATAGDARDQRALLLALFAMVVHAIRTAQDSGGTRFRVGEAVGPIIADAFTYLGSRAALLEAEIQAALSTDLTAPQLDGLEGGDAAHANWDDLGPVH